MPLTRTAQQHREAATVRSAPGRPGYYVPTLAELDATLSRLVDGLRAGTLTPAGEQRIREDMDALLARRLYLQTVAADS